MDLHHQTLVLERHFAATPAEVFAAFADPVARAAWSAPTEDAVVEIDSCEFRDGGRETARCGPKGNLGYNLAIVYHEVVPDTRIVFSEELSEGDFRLTVALVSFEMAPAADGGTDVRVTDQVASHVGAEGIEGHAEGYRCALANLEAWLRRAA